MKILFLANSSLAGSPVNLSKIINKYTEHESVSVLKQPFRHPKFINLKWDYDYISPDNNKVLQLINWADIIVQNQRIWNINTSKHQCIIYHAQPGGYKPNITNANLNGKKMVVGQYQALYYTDATPVPNMIDIWNQNLKPNQPKDEKVRIYYGFASESAGGWGYKGSKEVLPILNKINKKYDNVEISYVMGKSYNDVLKIKNKCDICIGDIASGSYHISELESLSVGAVTFCNLRNDVENVMYKICGSKPPIIKVNSHNLENNITKFIENKEERQKVQNNSRKWVEHYWKPETNVQKYISIFEKIIY